MCAWFFFLLSFAFDFADAAGANGFLAYDVEPIW